MRLVFLLVLSLFFLLIDLSTARNVETKRSMELPKETSEKHEDQDTSIPGLQEFNVSLDFSNVGLTDLPSGFVDSKFLTYLTMNNNNIHSISMDAFKFVPNLSYLSLANNQLKSINLDMFSGLKNLQTLNLNGNCARNDPMIRYGDYKECWHFTFSSILPSLTHLYMKNNNLRNFVFLEGSLPMLSHLYLSDNLVQLDDVSWSKLDKFAPDLTHLYLENSGLREFRVSLMSNLTSLDLGENKITSICNEYCDESSLKLKGSSKLRSLSVKQNGVSRIEPDSFDDATNLSILDLSGNKISDIRERTFDNLAQLKELYLESNDLDKVNGDVTFKGLNNLEILWLDNNLISHLDKNTFKNLLNLKEIKLNDNRIFSIEPGTFSTLTRLHELSLAGNWLSRIPPECLPVSGWLTALDLSDNLFDNTQDIAVLNSTGILSLILQDNPLVNVSSRWLATMKNDFNLILGSSCYKRKEYPLSKSGHAESQRK